MALALASLAPAAIASSDTTDRSSRSALRQGADPEVVLEFTRGEYCIYSENRRTPVDVTIVQERTGETGYQGTITWHEVNPGCAEHGVGIGYWRLCAEQPAGEGFAAFSGCERAQFLGSAEVYLKRPQNERRPVFPLTADRPLIGQRAELTAEFHKRACHLVLDPVAMDYVKTCDWERSRKEKDKITLDARQRVAVGRLKKPGMVKLRVEVEPFDHDNAPYRRAWTRRSVSRR